MLDKRKLILCIIDTLILICSFTLVICLCYTSSLSLNVPLKLKNLLPVLIIYIVSMFIFRLAFKIYNNIWRYARVGIYVKLIFADFLSGIILLSIGAFFKNLYLGFGPTLCIQLISCLCALVARFCYQLLYAHNNAVKSITTDEKFKTKVAIVGAGNIGATLAQEFLRNPQSNYIPVCFIDKDKNKAGQNLNGLPVYIENGNIQEKLKKLSITEIIIALPDLDSDKKNELYNLYSKHNLKVKLYDYPLSEYSSIKKRALRDFKIEDLLFRNSIKLDNKLSRDFYFDKTILVTGGGGSIGSELCRQIASFKPKKLAIFDIYENNAYDIQQELIKKYGKTLNLEVIIGSVRDTKRLNEVFYRLRPQIVIHAAAHKHVPLMEQNSVEAIKNNVLGTYNTANMAEKYNTEKFVLISTDKAVNPTNVMGATKRLCEMIIQSRNDSKTQFVAVRFGNVLGSNGSVIPLFKKQIENGGPVTITDKRIIRYFMTIPEASQLVLQAGAMAHNGELFVLDMGKPVHIYDLAVNMIKFAGLIPNKDIHIKEIGLRPGEKLYEELLIKNEKLYKTENELIFVERDTPFSRQEIEDKIDVLRKAIKISTNDAVKKAMKNVVTTYHDPSQVNTNAKDAYEMINSSNKPTNKEKVTV